MRSAKRFGHEWWVSFLLFRQAQKSKALVGAHALPGPAMVRRHTALTARRRKRSHGATAARGAHGGKKCKSSRRATRDPRLAGSRHGATTATIRSFLSR